MKRLLLGLALCAFAAPAFAGGDRGGYAAHGWGVSRTEESGEAWRYRRLDDGPPPCLRSGDRDGRDGEHRDFDRDRGCGHDVQEVTLPGDFFEDGGGVGVAPEGGGGGGGFFFDEGAASASSHAFAFASASASANVSVRFNAMRMSRPMKPPMMMMHHKSGCGCR